MRSLQRKGIYVYIYIVEVVFTARFMNRETINQLVNSAEFSDV